MKRITTAMLFMTTILFLNTSASAADSGWSNYTSISEITASNRDYYTIQLSSPTGTKNCKNKDTVYLEYDAKGSQAMFQILLNALISKNEVRVYLTGRCELHGYSEISSASIRP